MKPWQRGRLPARSGLVAKWIIGLARGAAALAVSLVLLFTVMAVLTCWGMAEPQRFEPLVSGVSWLGWLRCSY